MILHPLVLYVPIVIFPLYVSVCVRPSLALFTHCIVQIPFETFHQALLVWSREHRTELPSVKYMTVGYFPLFGRVLCTFFVTIIYIGMYIPTKR